MATGNKPVHTAKKHKSGGKVRERRSYRINGENRGGSPTLAAATKYVRSGGPGRMAQRKARLHGCGLPSLHLGKHGERDQH